MLSPRLRPSNRRSPVLSDRRRLFSVRHTAVGVGFYVASGLVTPTFTVAQERLDSVEESTPLCLEWQSAQVDIVEGRLPEYGTEPALRFAMAQAEMGLGVVRTVVELTWRDTERRFQTLFDATSAGDFAGGVSFFRAENGLHVEYLKCGWGSDCTPIFLSYRYDKAASQYVGNDSASAEALLHICQPAYFAFESSGRRIRPK